MKVCPVAILAAFILIAVEARAQSIVGTWQLVRHTTCLENEIDEDEDTFALLEDMQSRSGGTPSVIRFKDDNSGEESIRLLEKGKATRRNTLLYKLSEDKLYFLDKKSRLLVGSYDVDRLSADSLIFSDASRACETRIFVRLAEK